MHGGTIKITLILSAHLIADWRLSMLKERHNVENAHRERSSFSEKIWMMPFTIAWSVFCHLEHEPVYSDFFQ